MTQTVLITGARGRLGRACIDAFRTRGWNIKTLVRSNTPTSDPLFNELQAWGVSETLGDATNAQDLKAAASGVDVIVAAAHPAYEHWQTVVPAMTQALIVAAQASRASIVFPGNVYPYGEHMPPVLSASTPHRPSCQHASIRAQQEAALKRATETHGLQTLIVRAGGYMDGRDTGNWLESYICKDVPKGEFMYPGPLDVPCEWAYLPDVATVIARIAEKRQELGRFEDIGVRGHSITGAQLKSAVEAVAGHTLQLKKMPWRIVRLMAVFSPRLRAVCDLKYLFFVPHKIDGARLEQIVPDWQRTSLVEALSSMPWHKATAGVARETQASLAQAD